LKCWRYVLTDHYSSSVCVRYYAGKGESQEHLYEFLLYAWGQKQSPSYVFHGVPELLVWDKGSANMSRTIKNALTALRVKNWAHAAGNPRAKGQVENANNLVETHFECLLRLEEVKSIEALNEAAERWSEAWNAGEALGQPAFKRSGVTLPARRMLWQRIRPEQLRELPDGETCRQIFTTGVQTRKVAGDLTIRVAHPKAGRVLVYSVSDLPGILAGQEVSVQPVLVDEEPLVAVTIRDGRKEMSFEVAPIEVDEAGFDINAAVLGEEYKALKDTRRERNAKELAALAGEGGKDAPFAGITGGAGFKTHSLIRPLESPFIRQTTGARIDLPEHIRTHEIIVSVIEMAKRVRAAGIPLPEGFISEMRREYPEGVTTAFVDEFIKARKPVKQERVNTEGVLFKGGAKENSPAYAEEEIEQRKFA